MSGRAGNERRDFRFAKADRHFDVVLFAFAISMLAVFDGRHCSSFPRLRLSAPRDPDAEDRADFGGQARCDFLPDKVTARPLLIFGFRATPRSEKSRPRSNRYKPPLIVVQLSYAEQTATICHKMPRRVAIRTLCNVTHGIARKCTLTFLVDIHVLRDHMLRLGSTPGAIDGDYNDE
jgi:hypothetical protein